MPVLNQLDYQQLGRKAASLLTQNRYAEARPLFEQLIGVNANDATAWRGLGECHHAQSDKQAAARALTRANELAPDDPRTLNDIAVILFQEKQYEGALSFLCNAVKYDPDFADARLNLATVLGSVTLADQTSCLRPSLLMQTLKWVAENAPDEERSDLLSESDTLRNELLGGFHERYQNSNQRVLLLSPTVSMGALFYIFESWHQCLEYMGVPSMLVPVGEDLDSAIESFDPSTILSLDGEAVWGTLGKKTLKRISKTNAKIGLVSEFGDEMCDADFYITFHLHPERDNRIARQSRDVVSLPFAFNPLMHHAAPARTLWDYAFVGTNSPLKEQETVDYLVPIASSHTGILAGSGWPGRFGNLSQAEAGNLYNFAAICPNFHLKAQIETGNEVNERTHVIAACGGFQLVDNPAALREMYAEDEIASAASAKEYYRQFKHYLSKPTQRYEMAMRSMRTAWKSHSQFHRLINLINFLQES
jgi:hypothetical protein